MINSNFNMDLIKDYKNNKLNFYFPCLPSIKQVFLVFTEDDWQNFSEVEMPADDKLDFFHTSFQSEKNIGYRFKYLKKNNPCIFFEDNNMKNFYIPAAKISIQNLNSELSTFKDILCKGKNIYYSFTYDNQLYSYIVFEFDNIFYYKSILENFDTFFIASKHFDKVELTKKVIDKVTWKIPLKNTLIEKKLSDMILSTVQTKDINIGIVKLTEYNRDLFFNFIKFLNFNLDYFLYNNSLIWKSEGGLL